MIERSYYAAVIGVFLEASESQILGKLANKHHFALDVLQKNAWLIQIASLKEQVRVFPDGHIFLEFSIPRMGKRVDVVLVIGGVIFVVEYKAGAEGYDRGGIDQVMDYALDLKNFHEGSHDKFVIPILVSTKASPHLNSVRFSGDNVAFPLLSNGEDLSEVAAEALAKIPAQPEFSVSEWALSGYKPTPTIVEAAQALYREHSVQEISRSDAGATNLTNTTNCIFEIIEQSKRNHKKSICFITGVPGAGKTLAGLNIAVQRLQAEEDEHAVFLSGNGPLVMVLREALVRDEIERAAETGKSLSKRDAMAKVRSFIQNIHHFRDEYLRPDAIPIEHVVVFDEAQRAWNRSSAEKFMIQKRGETEFNMSEPEFLISVMDRKNDWCTIICLIGGGQEINTGEAGLTEWFEALEKHFNHWVVYYPDQIAHKDYNWGQNFSSRLTSLQSSRKESLHLSVSIRSYRAEKLSAFVDAIIDGEIGLAQELYGAIRNDYPIVLTRKIRLAREWLRTKARGTERYGLLASSGAIRLKPEGINVKNEIDAVPWFLNDKSDVRSAYYLEDAATEFDIQGLELDWTAVCWDADFRRTKEAWGHHAFKGTRWQKIHDRYRRVYLANSYRVLLTRARQGMVIFVPTGDEADETRPPRFYDEIYLYFCSCKIPTLDEIEERLAKPK
jgi:hypothetical protein